MQCTMNFKATYKPLKATKVPAKAFDRVSSRKRIPEPEISLDNHKSKKQKTDFPEDTLRDRVLVYGSKRVKPEKDFARCSSRQIKHEKLTNNDKGVVRMMVIVVYSCYSSIGSRIDAEMSPEKALRVAMLKSRFADTIFKATHFDHDVKSVFSKMQQRREQLVKEQIKEKAMLEAEVIALRRASERMMLEKMGQTVDLNNYVSLPGAPMGYPNFSLERLGLRLKDD